MTDTGDELQAHKQQVLSPRQNDVLEQALRLLVEGGDRALTTASIARAANCSKESLYKWFGDRDGLLTAMVRWQASKVRVVPLAREKLDAESLFSSLEHFARDWLLVLSGCTSIALNRLAVSHAASGRSALGEIVLSNGPVAMAERLKPILTMGKEAGLLIFDDIDEAFRTFFGLVVRDMQIRLLLGDRLKLTDEVVIRDARRATKQFFALYGA
ncbi:MULTISPECIES: TetR/AcrR family transcriptional regulator [Brucella]|uniref:TetR/AcrR family transcriptional regulator n=1 Tax=Brucella inopinata TaxID=1218315 RepID=A0AAW7BCW8_9HYPH|nr:MULTISPECIES: TetR/AcrR family transcriptional regulator [Brucella]KEY04404.1 TetR family transcriptional regulator [Brucella suis bv. 4 str. 40]EFM57094.1 TetR family transcriptional regulator [Brucella inopinata BO1]EFM58129.1 TetR family transcriptional regulator [Brucella sp. BO2]MDL2332363.1 TetR/AcrR family transcriptional regulator [Brucella inopinata]QPN29046.1 TetR/AcrR family transcriptional regulator [Brucella sp. BO2]